MTQVTATRLAELDETFLGWLPGLLAQHGDRVQAARAAHLAAPGDVLAHRTLPSSVVRRALLVESLGAKRVFLEEDADGLAAILRGVTVASDGADVAVLGFGGRDPDSAAALLSRFARALSALRPGGLLVVRVRAPWDPLLVELTDKLALEHKSYVRDVDHRLLACGHVVDGGGDLVVLAPAADSAQRLAAIDAASLVTPAYFWFDLDALDEDKLAGAGLTALVARVEALLGREATLVQSYSDEKREIGVWYDASGAGFTAEINREWSHLLVGLMPYHEIVESAVLHAGFEIFGGPASRARPRRTERSPGYAIFA